MKKIRVDTRSELEPARPSCVLRADVDFAIELSPDAVDCGGVIP